MLDVVLFPFRVLAGPLLLDLRNVLENLVHLLENYLGLALGCHQEPLAVVKVLGLINLPQDLGEYFVKMLLLLIA